MEYEKVRSAVEMGAEAIMDLSSYGDTRSFRRKLTADCPAMIGTVPIMMPLCIIISLWHKSQQRNGWISCGCTQRTALIL